MSYLALYNKYRSKTFEEIVGQEAIVKTLKNALANNKIAHAYLFCGPRGTGKTSLARLFAKALNCEKGVGTICNKCASCTGINAGSNPDIIEIDAASNSGVDNVRSLIEQSRYLPTQGKYKVYIIDEVHNMSKEAFNALLKTLEEPPKHVVFILCTTDPYKVLPTILSRCQRYNLTKLSKDQLKTLLKSVLSKEKVTCESGVIEVLTDIANGGARDALSILDQLIAYSDGKITLKSVLDVFGLTNSEVKIELLTHIHKKDSNNLIKYLDTLFKSNIDVSRFVTELLNLLKDILIYLKTSNKSLLEYTSLDVIQKVSKLYNSNEILHLIDLFIECENKIKTSSNPNFVFEVYVLKSIETEQNTSIFEEIPAKTTSNLKTNVEQTKEVVEKSVAPTSKTKPLYKDGKSYTLAQNDVVKLMFIGSKYKQKRESLSKGWDKIDALLLDDNTKAFAALLKEGMPLICTKDVLILKYDFKLKAAKANLISNNEMLVKMIKDLFKLDIKLYAINKNEYEEYYKKYQEYNKSKKLPFDIKDETIKFKEVKTKED